eukprot:TRINITY_DN4798_c0_g1_i1.p1 TRINITY_DN4798_c0_g1~~TRINITY_DN4798_c0_g1_i1.p1  ORF type:complete len:1067 (-),score=204.55 TRINITY_DN4798_c0_g1_i1:38-3238(-)
MTECKRKTFVVYKPLPEKRSSQVAVDVLDFNERDEMDVIEEIVEVSDGDVFEPESLVEQQNLMYSEREADAIFSIMKFLVDNEPKVLKQYFLYTRKQDYDTLADCMLSLSFAQDVTYPMLKFFIEDEFNTSDPKKILRENSAVSKLIKSYLNRFGNDYLKEILSKNISIICNNEKKMSYEVNTHVVSDIEALRNIELLGLKVDNILLDITNNVDTMPPGIRLIAKYIRESAEELLPKKVNSMIGAFLFLRYFNPAICFPDSINGILSKTKISHGTRRNLVLLTKILQNVSNGQDFKKKEFYMQPFNGFVRSRQELLNRYFQDVTNFQVNLLSIHDNLINEVSVHDIHIFHSMLFRYADKVQKLFSSPETAEEFNRLLELLGTYQAKTSFSYLEESSQKFVQNIINNRHEEVSYVGAVNLRRNKRGKQYTECLLIVGMNRLFVIKSKDGKLLRDFHQLDIVGITCLETSITILCEDQELVLECRSEQVENILNSIRRTFEYKFPGMPQRSKFYIDAPDHMMQDIRVKHNENSCAPLVITYNSICNYYVSTPNEEFKSDLGYLYENTNTIRLTKYYNITDTPLSSSDFLPVFHTLGYSPYFKELIIENIRLDRSGFKGLAILLGTNSTLKSVTLSNISHGSSRTPFCLIFETLKTNPDFSVTKLDLSKSSISDKAMEVLGDFITENTHCFEYLDLSNTVGDKGGSGFRSFLESLSPFSFRLNTLKLNGNKLIDFQNELCNLLHTTAQLHNFEISSTKLERNNIVSLVQNGFNVMVESIKELNLSNLVLKSKSISGTSLAPLKEWWSNNMVLESVNLSAVSLIPEEWPSILTSFSSSNPIALNISKNNIGPRGAQGIANVIAVVNLKELNISENNLGDEGLLCIIQAIYNNENISALDISNNFAIRNTKTRSDLVEALIQMASSDFLPLQTLVMRGELTKNRLREILGDFLITLKDNTQLQYLDITGHGMGNAGAIQMGKMLYLNNTLNTIEWDDNLTTYLGFWHVAEALTINPFKRTLTPPYQDIVRALSDQSSERLFLLTVISKMHNPEGEFEPDSFVKRVRFGSFS